MLLGWEENACYQIANVGEALMESAHRQAVESELHLDLLAGSIGEGFGERNAHSRQLHFLHAAFVAARGTNFLHGDTVVEEHAWPILR
eukprot:scaffold95460_cov32-Tisochrysis_lutea.AAC.2